jgi:hypothetical protein
MTATGQYVNQDDAAKLGAIHHGLYGKRQSLPDRMDVALPALAALILAVVVTAPRPLFSR